VPPGRVAAPWEETNGAPGASVGRRPAAEDRLAGAGETDGAGDVAEDELAGAGEAAGAGDVEEDGLAGAGETDGAGDVAEDAAAAGAEGEAADDEVGRAGMHPPGTVPAAVVRAGPGGRGAVRGPPASEPLSERMSVIKPVLG